MTELNDEYKRKKGIYLLPNLLTTAGLFAGFYAIVAAMRADFEPAAIALFTAMLIDGLDGRVARLTGTESDFGAQYDSLSDMVCFGIAPALVVYSWGIQYLGKVGWLASFVYAAATGLRLARFNLRPDKNDKKYFIGLPSPSAAAVVAGMVWVGTDFAIPGKVISELVALVTVMLGLLMVSNLRYHSFKEINFKGRVPFLSVLLVVLGYSLIASDPPKILFSVFLLYVLSGPLLFIRSYFAKKKEVVAVAVSEQASSYEQFDQQVLATNKDTKEQSADDAVAQ